MPKTKTVVVKSFAALLATGLGTLGGFNYVSGGNVWGTGNDYPALPAPTSISAVANSLVVPMPQTEPQTQESAETRTNSSADPVAPEATDPDTAEPGAAETDGSCCTSTGRAGFLTGTESPAPIGEPADDEG